MKVIQYKPLTRRQCATYDQACDHIYFHYGSYPKIAAALKDATGTYLAAQTVRVWFKDRKIPAHYAVILADKTNTNPFHLLPWLFPFVEKWLAVDYVIKELPHDL